MGLFKKSPKELIKMGEELAIKQASKAIPGEEKAAAAVEELISALDDSHHYPDSWGLFGKGLELIDGPVIRFVANLAVQSGYELGKAKGLIE